MRVPVVAASGFKGHVADDDAFRTLVLIDGQKISEQKSMSGSPMLIDASRIERIEVIKDSVGRARYGAFDREGVILVTLKKNSAD